MRKLLHNFFLSCWYSGSPLAYLLLPFSALFALVIWVRRRVHSGGRSQEASAVLPVIVVGNITVGGTGKSPVVSWLARQLSSRGMRPGIVSRGYGGSHNGSARMVTADTDPALVGDEPVMLAIQTACPVCVCADRAEAVAELEHHQVDVVISDDGLQHYRMPRVAELIVIDGERGLGNGWLLPAGPLREQRSRLSEADALLINGSSNEFSGINFYLRGEAAVSLSSGESCGLRDFAGKQVLALAGIGNPLRFYRLLESFDIEIVPVSVPDHGVVNIDALRDGRDCPVLMTEKDAVKYRHAVPANCWYIPVGVTMNAEHEKALLDALEIKIENFNKDV